MPILLQCAGTLTQNTNRDRESVQNFQNRQNDRNQNNKPRLGWMQPAQGAVL